MLFRSGIAILFVMLGHCIVLNGMNDPYFYDVIVAIQMPLFMVVSGFTLGLKRDDRMQKPSLASVMQAIGRKAMAYLIPFFSWMILTHLSNPIKEFKCKNSM